MAIKPSDIEFFLSGGPTNSNPNNSIGGLPSSFPLLGSANNLFPDISSEIASSGKTDYRCFYISNESTSDSLIDAEVYFEEQGTGGSVVQMGLDRSTEIQKLNIIGVVLSGSLTIRYKSTQLIVPWGSSAGQFETNLQTQISSVSPGVVVSTSILGNSYNFTVSFSDNRSHSLLEVFSNGLVGNDQPIASFSRVTSGSPINSVAPILSVDTVAPARVLFSSPTSESKLELGTMMPRDKVPVWVKRLTSPNTDYMESDHFSFKIIGRPF